VLRGARRNLRENFDLNNIWVSIHPDLMERDFDEQRDDLVAWMGDMGWKGENLGYDHEEHWHFTRIDP
jgi:hypothetical protein